MVTSLLFIHSDLKVGLCQVVCDSMRTYAMRCDSAVTKASIGKLWWPTQLYVWTRNIYSSGNKSVKGAPTSTGAHSSHNSLNYWN
jgi:hypothetical protein